MTTIHPIKYLAFLLLSLFLVSTGAAQTIQQSFDSPLGGLPTEWTLYKRNSGAPNNVAEIASYSDSNWLKLQRYSSSNDQAAVYYTGTTPSNLIADGSGSVTIRLGASTWTSSDMIGVAVRSQSNSYQPQGYYLAFTADKIAILHSPTNHTYASGTEMAASDLTAALNTDLDYQFQFSFIGSILSATLTTLDQSVTLGTVSVDTSDSQFSALTEFTEGRFAIRAGYSGNRTAYFKDVSVSMIPEPSTASLTGLGLLFALIYFWNKRKNRSV